VEPALADEPAKPPVQAAQPAPEGPRERAEPTLD
jgi:3-deoxy-D-manno-octulosonic-acid transferase